MERWVLYLHLLSVLLFMLAHGVHVQVMWRLRTTDDPDKSLTLFESLPDLLVMRVLLAGVVVTGFVSAFLIPAFFGQWWMWISLAILLGITLVMRRWGGAYYGVVEDAATRAIEARRAPDADGSAVAARFATERATWHFAGVSAIGIGGVAVILWLMVFKPF